MKKLHVGGMLKLHNGLAAILVFAAVGAGSARAEIVYDTIPDPLPGNVPSLGYQANQTAEFGGLIAPDLSAGYTNLDTVTVAMSDWAKQSDWAGVGSPAGFNINLTMTLYSYPGSGTAVGADIGTPVTVNALIPWRPEADPSCGSGGGYSPACLNGSLSTVTFDFSSQNITLPSQLIYGLSFNTTTWGADPTGVPGPYESLNFGLSDVGPSVGSQPLPGTAYWNTETAGDYTDGGTAGVGVFRQDTGWAPYSGAVEFDVATPEPSTFSLIGLGLAGLGIVARKLARRA
jgi:hypothetical protein